MAERLVCNEKDAGSSPVTSTIRGSMYQGWRECFASNLRWVQFPPAPQNARIAQLVERHLAKVEVAGSNPVSRSKVVVKNECYFVFLTTGPGSSPGL